jgi:hypothetical protein
VGGAGPQGHRKDPAAHLIAPARGEVAVIERRRATHGVTRAFSATAWFPEPGPDEAAMAQSRFSSAAA